MKRHYTAGLLLVTLLLILSSWGWKGHYIISEKSAKSFNTEMKQFQSWATDLAEHASDADSRKSQDPDESPRHYIDIDNYPEFVSNGRIPHTLDSVIAIHGSSFVYDQGILPWATLKTYDSLKACFERKNWDKAMLFAADLGHYVADGHMPLHITRNYNGQFSGNYGIHSRYESSMIGDYENEIDYDGQQIQLISDTRKYIFSYLYQNYVYVDSVLKADDAATTIAGNTSSALYYSILWDETKSFTIDLFANASHALAELIYSAWWEAGTPSINTAIFGGNNKSSTKIYPLPATDFISIELSNPNQLSTSIIIYDIAGKVVLKEYLDLVYPYERSLRLNIQALNSGLYFIALNEEVLKLIVMKE